MPALLINLRIDSEEKFDLFKVTLSDLADHFDESHIKIRGARSADCVRFVRERLSGEVHVYQDLQEKDWVAATLRMVERVKSRSVFVYFEDHRLVAGQAALGEILADFDESRLDYLCYSFFGASRLDSRNLLPLGARDAGRFCIFDLDRRTLPILGKVSPIYYTFSLMSVVSLEYFTAILNEHNARIKFHPRRFIAALSRLFRYPGYRHVVAAANRVLSRVGVTLCIYDPSSPFNIEMMWTESRVATRRWRYGLLKDELFANYDDDNGAYGESLIKKGLYPFTPDKFDEPAIERMRPVTATLHLKAGEQLNCAYHSHVERIRRPPIVQIAPKTGAIEVRYAGSLGAIAAGESRYFYSNLGPVISCVSDSEVQIRVFDEIFQ